MKKHLLIPLLLGSLLSQAQTITLPNLKTYIGSQIPLNPAPSQRAGATQLRNALNAVTDQLFNFDSLQIVRANSVGDLASFTPARARIVNVLDLKRGGLFVYKPASAGLTVDNAVVFAAQGGGYYIRQNRAEITPEMYGALGDGLTDDSDPLSAFFNSPYTNLTLKPTSAFYRITKLIVVANRPNKRINAVGAIIRNSDTTKASLLFTQCDNLEILGGDLGYQYTPHQNGGGSQHALQVDKCRTVTIDHVHISNSPEMGIATTQCKDAKIMNSLIEHCWRDGTYAHNSVNVTYSYNIYNEIKDDAASFHDYGIDTPEVDRDFMTGTLGVTQATGWTVSFCQINRAYQGISSVGGKGLQIKNNTVNQTVLAGIVLMNQEYGLPGGTVVLNDAQVESNILINNGKTTLINGWTLFNSGQSSSGRAALVCASLSGPSNSIMPLGQPKRQSNIRIKNNSISASGSLVMHLSSIDGLVLSGNTGENATVTGGSLGGNAVEIWEVTRLTEESTNTITDTRSPVQHGYGVRYEGVSGIRNKWKVDGRTAGDIFVNNSPSLVDATVNGVLNNTMKCGLTGTQISTATNAFSFPHYAPFTPKSGFIQAQTTDAMGQHILSFDPTSTTILYDVSKASGKPLAYFYCVFNTP